MSRLRVTFVALLLLSAALPVVTSAATSDVPRGPFALGIIAGEPTGLSLKLSTAERTALDGAVAWSFDEWVDLHIHGDFLRQVRGPVEFEDTTVPVYYGIGFRLRLNEGARDDDFGVRFPVGLAWVFADGGLETFLELAPVLDLAPDTDLDVNAAIGLRYVFGSGNTTAR